MKKLSLAFYWHMHQPTYEIEGTYLMPWARLHAVKDYLDMLIILEKFPKIKLNFDIVPGLLDTLIDYCEGKDDIHSELSVSDTDKITDEERSFILNNFFSARFETMIYRSENYKELYQKRFAKDVCDITEFNNQELSDLMALFNLVWIDQRHFEDYPRLRELWDKQRGYTLEDRCEIMSIQRQIIKRIIPTYKKYIEEGRIELTTSPYYHPIIPILLDIKTAIKTVDNVDGLPLTLDMYNDASLQVRNAINKIEEIFGVRPKGMWSPELGIGPKTLELLAKEGVKWTVSDEGILANSNNYDFVRDFNGNLTDPYHLLKVYEYKTKTNPIDIIFRDRSIPNLINFEYAGIDSKMAAGDLYGKIKNIQNKLLVSPDDTHLLTIALDGENCWENYCNDGNDFLEEVYSKIENDNTLETVLISDYIEKETHKKSISKIFSGSWIDKTFKYWIGEPTKNKAWLYLKEVKDVFDRYAEDNLNDEKIERARRELMIAEGSDWFWWYGEPNNSGQDFVFDYMFRERLKNVYIFLGLEYPKYLDYSLITKVEKPFKHPTKQITPKMDGLNSSEDDWECSGNMFLLDGPVYRENKNVDKIHFGCDSKNVYIRLHVISGAEENNGIINKINQFYVYTRNATTVKERAYVRLISKTENQYPILKEKFDNEITLTLINEKLYPPRLTTCLHQNMWTLANPAGITIVYNDVVDVTIPFETLGINKGETVEFFMANTDSGVKNTYIPQEILLSMKRE